MFKKLFLILVGFISFQSLASIQAINIQVQEDEIYHSISKDRSDETIILDKGSFHKYNIITASNIDKENKKVSLSQYLMIEKTSYPFKKMKYIYLSDNKKHHLFKIDLKDVFKRGSFIEDEEHYYFLYNNVEGLDYYVKNYTIDHSFTYRLTKTNLYFVKYRDLNYGYNNFFGNFNGQYFDSDNYYFSDIPFVLSNETLIGSEDSKDTLNVKRVNDKTFEISRKKNIDKNIKTFFVVEHKERIKEIKSEKPQGLKF